MAQIQMVVPDIGDFSEVGVIEVLVQVGDTIKAEQSLVTVESDKASMEIPSSHAGVVQAVLVQVGDKVSQGSPLMLLEAAQQAAAAGAPTSSNAPANEQAPTQAQARGPADAPVQSAAQPHMQELRVPDIGDFSDVAVIEVLVQVGEAIKAEQSLITVESDKASMEIPASHGGVLQSLAVKVGDKVNKGDVLGIVLTNGTAAPQGAKAAPAQVPASPAQAGAAALVVAETTTTAPAGEKTAPSVIAAPAVVSSTAPATAPAVVPAADSGLPHASPSVRKFARELGVPLERVRGTGLKGRITQEDVQAYTRGVMQGTAPSGRAGTAQAAAGEPGAGWGLLPWPQVDFAKFGEVERKDLTRIQKISGGNLHRNWVRIPHVTNHDDADITDLEALRVQLNEEYAKSGVKVTMLAFLIKACVAALKKYPQFNASLDGEQLVLKKYFHMAFAADTPNGLVVPVIKHADQKGIVAISQELADLAAKAREGKLAPADMQGACFTISSLGGIGGTYFTPIINAPEVAILGVCRSQMRPVWDGKAFAPRLILPLSLSWDHRVIDGASAARFNAYLGQVLADFRRVML